MKVTRLHLILILIVLAAVGLYVAQTRHKGPKVKKVVVQEEPVEITPPPVNKENLARQTIAIAGEYWKIAKKEGRDLAPGQATLRLAKEYFTNNDFEQAISLAKESIEQLKSAPLIGKYYTVRRGDCLWNIARMEKHYGRGSMWVKIWRNNEDKTPDFDIIRANQVLFIP